MDSDLKEVISRDDIRWQNFEKRFNSVMERQIRREKIIVTNEKSKKYLSSNCDCLINEISWKIGQNNEEIFLKYFKQDFISK